MGWPQTIAIIATILISVIGGIIYNNRRLDDLRNDMNARFADFNARFADINTRFAEIHDDLREIRAMLNELLRARETR